VAYRAKSKGKPGKVKAERNPWGPHFEAIYQSLEVSRCPPVLHPRSGFIEKLGVRSLPLKGSNEPANCRYQFLASRALKVYRPARLRTFVPKERIYNEDSQNTLATFRLRDDLCGTGAAGAD
jgi:hypothetical protein